MVGARSASRYDRASRACVSGRNDLTRSDLVQLDYLYVSSQSLWWDLKIIFETPMTMVRGTGAY